MAAEWLLPFVDPLWSCVVESWGRLLLYLEWQSMRLRAKRVIVLSLDKVPRLGTTFCLASCTPVPWRKCFCKSTAPAPWAHDLNKSRFHVELVLHNYPRSVEATSIYKFHPGSHWFTLRKSTRLCGVQIIIACVPAPGALGWGSACHRLCRIPYLPAIPNGDTQPSFFEQPLQDFFSNNRSICLPASDRGKSPGKMETVNLCSLNMRTIHHSNGWLIRSYTHIKCWELFRRDSCLQRNRPSSTWGLSWHRMSWIQKLQDWVRADGSSLNIRNNG
jgi:hypothetical protein